MASTDSLQWEQSKQVNTNLIVKLNSGTTEGTNQFTFNGSTAKTVNITASSIGAVNTAGTGLSKSGTTLNHANSITAGNCGPTTNVTIGVRSSFIVPYIKYDAQGHITGRSNKVITLNSNMLDTGDIVTSLSGTASSYSDTQVPSAKLLKKEVTAIYQHWSYCYNNSSSNKTCYIILSGIYTNASRASLLIFAIGNSSDRCCCRHIKMTDYSTGPLQSTMYQGSTSACWNGNVYINSSGEVVTSISQARGVALTNVEPYTAIDIFASGSCWIENSYFG